MIAFAREAASFDEREEHTLSASGARRAFLFATLNARRALA
jgi:hypothetical protein